MDVLKRLKKLQSEYGWSDYRIAKKAGKPVCIIRVAPL